MKLPVPVTIVTGALGAGKTTAICHLLRCKEQLAPDETWAVLVNEFGALGIDASLIQGSDVQSSSPAATAATAPSRGQGRGRVVVRELAGGCMCCSLSGPLGAAIAQLVRNAKPDRLIIEPSGLGHPAGLLDVLKGEHLKNALDVRAVICLVDCRQAVATDFAANTTYQDQVNVADVLVGAKADRATEEQVEAFHAFAAELFPPKSRIFTAAHGALDPSLLDEPRHPAFTPWFTPAAPGRRAGRRAGAAAGAASQAVADAADGLDRLDLGGEAATKLGGEAAAKLFGSSAGGDAEDSGPADRAEEAGASGRQWEQAQAAWSQGKPARFVSLGSEQHLACGWLFPPERVFDSGRLQRLLEAMAGGRPTATAESVTKGMGVGETGTAASAAVYAGDQGGELRPTAAGAAGAGAIDPSGAGGRAGAAGGGSVVVRAKGVFRVSAKSWVAMQLQPQAAASSTCSGAGPSDASSLPAGSVAGQGGGTAAASTAISTLVEVAPIAYRKDSRLEVILTRPLHRNQKSSYGAASGQHKEEAGEAQEAGVSGLSLQLAVDALARQDWDAFERALCACCTR